jgi:hypothetical protein
MFPYIRSIVKNISVKIGTNMKPKQEARKLGCGLIRIRYLRGISESLKGPLSVNPRQYQAVLTGAILVLWFFTSRVARISIARTARRCLKGGRMLLRVDTGHAVIAGHDLEARKTLEM